MNAERDAGAEAHAPQPVADAAHRLDRVVRQGAVDLVAQVPDGDVDHVGAVLVGVVPDALQQLEAGDGLAGPLHQRLEQRELARGELELGVAAPAPCGPPGRGASPPASSTAGRVAAGRRASARSRASSSSNANGLTR